MILFYKQDAKAPQQAHNVVLKANNKNETVKFYSLHYFSYLHINTRYII